MQLSTVRDLSRFWLQRGEILQERGAAQLDVADSQLSTVFGGFDIGDEILGALQPNQQIFVVAPRHADGSTSTGLPMVAIVWQLKPNSTAPTSRYRMAFQSAIALSNVERANRGVSNGN